MKLGSFQSAIRDRLRHWLLGRDHENRMFADFRRRLMEEHSIWGAKERVHMADTALVNDALFNVSSGEIFVGDHVIFGHRVTVITGIHDVDRFGEERVRRFPTEGRDVRIEDGVWIGSGTIVLGPCTIGRDAVIGAGSVVRSDVAPRTVVAGVPARYIRSLGQDDGD